MGMFGKKEPCIICSNEKAVLEVADGYVCRKCLLAAGGHGGDSKEMTVSEIKRKMEMAGEFVATKKIDHYFELDETHGLFRVPFTLALSLPGKVYRCEDIIGFELLEDGNTLMKGGVGSAVAGGVLFGGAGAIAGSVIGKKQKRVVNRLQIKITMNSIAEPAIIIDLVKTKTNADSFIYRQTSTTAHEILSLLSVITKGSKQNTDSPTIVSNVDELIKLKGLLDSGILTPEEFEAEKEKILAR